MKHFLFPALFAIVGACSEPSTRSDESVPRAALVTRIVRVCNTKGEPLSTRVARTWNYENAELAAEWPRTSTLYVLPGSKDTKGPAGEELLRESRRVEKGAIEFDLPQDVELIVALAGPGQAVQVQRITPGANTQVPTFVLDEPQPTGAIHFVVREPQGREELGILSLRLHHRETGLPLIERRTGQGESRERSASGAHVFERVPEGEYVLVAQALSRRDWHGRVFVSIPMASVATPVVVHADKASEVTLRFEEPAYLDLTLSGRLSADDVSAFESSHSSANSPWGPMTNLGNGADLAKVRLRPASAYPFPVPFKRFGWAGSSAAGPHLYTTLQLNTKATSEALPSGEFVLEVELPGGREVTQKLVLESGQTSEVKLTFPPVAEEAESD